MKPMKSNRRVPAQAQKVQFLNPLKIIFMTTSLIERTVENQREETSYLIAKPAQIFD